MFKKFIASILFCISAIAIATVSVSAAPQTFTDVNPNDWHYEYIEYKPQKVIGINDIKAKTIIHEFGHYLASEYGNKTDLNNLFNTEVSGVVKTVGRDYPKTSYQEFFADAFACYQLKNEQLKQNAPQTYEYIKNMISNL